MDEDEESSSSSTLLVYLANVILLTILFFRIYGDKLRSLFERLSLELKECDFDERDSELFEHFLFFRVSFFRGFLD